MRIQLTGAEEKLFGFMYFWGKHVKGFNSEKHCARCLSGSYEKSVSASMPLNVWREVCLSGDVLYICGVSKPYRWEKNFHIAVKNGSGRIEKTLYNGTGIIIEDAEEIVFDGEKARIKYPNLGPEFLTCRNFQFGVHFYE
jgi:hypothetical protein